MEEWKQVKDFPNFEVSNYGNVRNIKKNKLVPISNGKINLYENGQKVRCCCITSLVYSHFVEDKPVARFFFRDNNPNNFRADNLYTTTERNVELLKDYMDGMSLQDMRKKYKVDNPHSLGWKLGGRRKAKPKLFVTSTIEKSEKIEPTDPIILRLREKYRKMKDEADLKGISVRISDLYITAMPKRCRI